MSDDPLVQQAWHRRDKTAAPRNTVTVSSITEPVDVNIEIDESGLATEVTLGTRLTETTFTSRAGSLTETAPASDTASSGLNGRLQRIAQRLTSLIALLPASLGQKTKANSLAVTLASDSDAVAVTGTFYQATQPVSNADQPDLTGTWGYKAGVSGSPTLPGGAKVLAVAAHATSAASMTIDGGDSIPIPANTGFALGDVFGQTVAPTLVFTGTDSFFVGYLT